jgi:hypothetical protein
MKVLEGSIFPLEKGIAATSQENGLQQKAENITLL